MIVLLRIILGFSLYFLVDCSRSRVSQCLKDYVPKVSALGLDQDYINRLGNILEKPESGRKENNHVHVVLDVGLGSMWHSDVFRHMVQLNITGFDQNRHTSFNCEYESIPREVALETRNNLMARGDNTSSFYVLGNFPRLHSGSWYDILANFPHVSVLMNDVSDQEYFNNQFLASCKLEWEKRVHAHCFVPLLTMPKSHNVTIDKHRLDKFTFDQVKVMLAAYRDLIRCMVPAERLFEFNLNSMPAEEYWSKLVSFLKIDVGGGAGTGGAGAGAGGGAVGVKYLSEGGTVCDSVSMRTDARHAKRVQCADEYASRMASVHGEQFRKFSRDALLRPLYTPRRAPEDTNRLVLGVGPGTSGTRTMHFAVTQLDITALHFQSIHARSVLRKNITRHDFDLDMKILEKESPDRRVFWSDTPVPYHWWYLHKVYPNTNFMITDVRNDTAWMEKRYKDHCYGNMIVNEPTCIAPLPFGFERSTLAKEFFRLIQIKLMSAETNHRMYDAYRELVRCIVPSDKLWWVYLPELKSSEEFWTRLMWLTNATLSSKKRDEYIAKGIPRCGSAGCYWNGKKYSVSY